MENSTRRLSEQDINFSDEIMEIDGLLNFYIDCCFNVDEVFGTHVETSDNDDWLNIYANYDIQKRAVCDTLLVILSHPQCTEGLTYMLDDSEKELLTAKMNQYCLSQENMTLEQYCSQLQTCDEEPYAGQRY